MIKKIFFVVIIIVINLQAQSGLYKSLTNRRDNFNSFTDKSVERKIDSLILRMTIKEKVGQLVQIVGTPGYLEKLIKEGSVGSILIGTGVPGEVNRIQKLAMKSGSKIPLLFAHDVIHGYYTIYPVPLGEAASWNPEVANKMHI